MRRSLLRLALAVAQLLLFAPIANAALMVGPISDFDDGTLQGWVTPKPNTSNPGDFLQVAPAPSLAAFNASINGTIDPAVTAIEADLMRPSGSGDIEIRLVLFGPGTGNRWTSTTAATVLGDGVWRHYRFSILEADLTRVLGAGTYADLTSGLNRLMFRYDPGAPNAGGSGGTGTFGIDNIAAVPEPGTALLLLAGLGGLGIGRSGRRPLRV